MLLWPVALTLPYVYRFCQKGTPFAPMVLGYCRIEARARVPSTDFVAEDVITLDSTGPLY